MDQPDHFTKGVLSFHHLSPLEIQTRSAKEQLKPVDEERLPQGSQETPTLVITANKVQDLEELGPAAVTYLSKLEGLPPDQWAKAWVTAAKEQGQQEQGGAVPVQGLEEQEVQPAQKDQEVLRVGHKGGRTRGHNWYDLTEQEGKESKQEESPMVTAAKAAAKAAAKEAASTAALAAHSAAALATAKAAQEVEMVVQEDRAGSSQDHRVQQDREEAVGQQGQEEAVGSRVSKAKEVQAGILAKLTQWWGGCQ